MAGETLIPQDLRERLRSGKVIPFIGAGVSRAVRGRDGERLFPSWKELLLEGADRLEIEQKAGQAQVVRDLLELPEPEYLSAARRLQEHLEKSVWFEFLEKQIDIEPELAEPESLELARKVWQLGSRLIITTNYDRVLHWACPDLLRLSTWDIQATAAQRGLLRDGFVRRPTLWHLHGQIQNTAELILTPDGYESLYPSSRTEERYKAARTTFRHLIAARSLLFIGFSLDDQHIGIELQGVKDLFDGLMGPHYLLIRERELERSVQPGVVPIPFSDFGQPLVELVQELGQVAAEATESSLNSSAAASAETPSSPMAGSSVASAEPESADPERIDLSTYRRAVADRWSNVRILRHTLNIQRHYFRAQAKTLGPDGEPVDVVSLLLAERPSRLCLFGPSGSGKTAALRRLLWEAAEQERAPFFIPLRDHTSPLQDESDSWIDLVPWLEAAVDVHHVDAESSEELRHRIQERSGLFIFDGFDELRFEPTRAARIADAIEAFFAGHYGAAKVVITSRTEEDLQGRFSGYEFYRLLPVGKDQLQEFARILDLNFPVVNTLLAELTRRPFFELRPVMLLIALLGIDTTSPLDLEEIESHFELMEWVLGRLLREEQREIPRSEELSGLTPEVVRSLRFHILESMVRKWPTSGEPVRLPESAIQTYAQKAFLAILKREMPAVHTLKYLVPTGICLELEERGEHWYVFVHNSIQEFLYARVLRKHIRDATTAEGRPETFTPNGQALLFRDYYSAEILRLLGRALNGSDIQTLLDWAMDPKCGQMVRKVSLGALGFVRHRHQPGLRLRLLEAFEKERVDLGVAGRIVEALRRLEEPTALGAFVEKLDRYPPRPLRPGSLARPLTYEINEPLPGIERFSERLEQHLEHQDSVVRKHALILLMRGPELPLHWVVRFCLRELEATEKTGKEAEAPTEGVVEHLRSLRYGLEALRRLGTGVNLELAEHLSQRLAKLSWVHQIVMEDLRQVLKRLRSPPGTPAGGLISRSSRWQQPGAGNFWDRVFETIDVLEIYLIRHGESDGNRNHRFLGSWIDGALTGRGRRQAEALAGCLQDRFGDPQPEGALRLVSAPMGRARETSEILGAALLGVSVKFEPLLTEMNFGNWTGKTKAEVHEENPELYAAWREDPGAHRPPRGESLFEVRARACAGFRRQVEKMLGLQPQGVAAEGPRTGTSTLILVGHFFPLAEIFQAVTKKPMDPQPVNCAVNRLRLTREETRVAELDETDHLLRIGFNRVRFEPPNGST